MKNKFYTDFDIERIEKSNRNDYRSPFQIDRDRIIHSSEFRRLQGKTQVFLPGEYDYYRTRLTHSIEVAQIGRSICNYIFSSNKDIFNSEFYINSDLVESACLAHDLGHPPFGHAGERTLHNLMKPYGGFEGNAQTLRLLTEIFYRTENHRRGMKPTRAFLDSILKYKSLFGELDNPKNHFIYNEQNKYLNFAFNNFLSKANLKPGSELNGFKSIECQIMDWADDTAYAINDLVDSISGSFITIYKLLKWKEKNENSLSDIQKEYLKEIFSWMEAGNYKANFGSQIGKFILACSIEETQNYFSSLTNRYKFNLVIDKNYLQKVELYKKISSDIVFKSSQLHQIEFKGNKMLHNIFKVLEENYITDIKPNKLLPDFSDLLIRKENDKNKRARLVCDYLAGMTDSFAIKTFKRLFNADYNFLFDLNE
ncbi:MAG: deoxyguanosinetriphosphate triphosphohydrolase [Ignavibacteriae bacterium]|nr:MAG: deoxyguanosinetriphosphate triphosphohydrolase [Ignavibacteriota bacterium]